jgi:CheY-like chemotaxis protein
MHILLIDDSSSTRSLLRTLINSGQAVRHEISEASSGEEALHKVGSGAIKMPDLIIADINMGGMNGYEVCRQFRQRFGGVSDIVPYIITVTANEGIEVINKVLDAGANDYMPKPVNVKILQIRLRFAERLLAQVRPQVGGGGGAAADPRQVFIAGAIEYAEVPIAVVETSGADATFPIAYSNASLTSITQFNAEQLVGKSLSELEAWTPEFVQMVLGSVSQELPLSHVPLWSKIRQDNPVYLSFYPVRSGEMPVTHYLVVHHF